MGAGEIYHGLLERIVRARGMFYATGEVPTAEKMLAMLCAGDGDVAEDADGVVIESDVMVVGAGLAGLAAATALWVRGRG